MYIGAEIYQKKKVNIKMSVENGSKPTLKDVMLSLASIKNTVDGISNRICSVEERLCKVEEKLCKVGKLEIKVVSLEESQDFLSKRYEEQDKNIEETKNTNSRLQKENDILLNKFNILTKGLAQEQLKRNSLEQYGRREMIEISGISHEQNEDCIELAHQVCKLAAVDIKKKKIEIAHRIKNGDIIVKFTDRPTRDQLYANRINLKNKSIKDTGFHNETSIYLNESLSFDTKGLLRKKCKTLGYKKIIPDNGIIKVKVDNDTKWTKIGNYADLEAIKWYLLVVL